MYSQNHVFMLNYRIRNGLFGSVLVLGYGFPSRKTRSRMWYISVNMFTVERFTAWLVPVYREAEINRGNLPYF